MFLDQTLYAPDLGAPEPTTACEPDRIQPELGDVHVALDVDVRRLLAVAGIEK